MIIRNFLRKALTIFGDIKVYPFPMFIVYNPKSFRIKGQQQREIENIVQKGDILLRGFVNYLDGYFIPGTYSHAGLYVGNNQVIHSMAEGIFQEDVLNFCRCDKICIMRFKNILNNQIDHACNTAKLMLGLPYDFEAEENDNEYYCTEAVAKFYSHMQYKMNIHPQSVKFAGLFKRNIIIPDQFRNCDALECVYEKK